MTAKNLKDGAHDVRTTFCGSSYTGSENQESSFANNDKLTD